MATIRDKVLSQLGHLVGRRLSSARRAADMRGFDFSRVADDGSHDSSHVEFVLHVQCPWRVEGPDGIVTGRSDIWQPAESRQGLDWDTWDYEKNENLQDHKMTELLATSGQLVVESVEADDLGGAVLSLSGGYRIVIFPSGSTGEDWRLFRPQSPGHFVVSGGKVEEPPGQAGS